MKPALAATAFLSTFMPLAAWAQPLEDLAAIKALVAAHRGETIALEERYLLFAATTVSLTDDRGHFLNKISEKESITVWHNGTSLSKTLSTNGGSVDPNTEALEESILLKRVRSLEAQDRVQNNWPAVLDYLVSCDVKIIGRETWAGRPAIRLALRPGKPSDPANTLAVYASSIKGELVLDAANGQLIKLETEFVRDYLLDFNENLRTKKGTLTRTENQWVNGELWLPAKNLLRNPTDSAFARTWIQNVMEVKSYRKVEVGPGGLGTQTHY